MATRVRTIDPQGEELDDTGTDSGITAAKAVIVSSRATTANDVAESPQVTEDDQSIVDRVRAIMSQAPGDQMHMRIYRRGRNGQLEFLGSMSPHEFENGDLELVRDQWGPGDYQFRLIGAKGLMMRITQTIGAAPRTQMGASAATAPPQSDMSQILSVLIDGQNKLLEAISKRPDPREEMAANIQMLASLKTVFGHESSKSEPQNPLALVREVFDMVKTAKTSMRELSDDEPSAPASDPIALASQLLGVLPSLVGKQPQTVNEFPAIQIPPNMQRVAESTAANPPLEAQAQAQPQPQPNTNPVEESTEANQDMHIVKLLVQGAFAKILQMAETKASTDDAADYIADELPEQFLPYLELPNWWEILIAFEPRCIPHEAWIREAKAKADLLLAEDSGSDASNPSQA